jgi:hypothetical protein
MQAMWTNAEKPFVNRSWLWLGMLVKGGKAKIFSWLFAKEFS